MRKLLLKIKRFFFKKITGLNTEDLRRLVYVQKYMDHKIHENNRKRYNEILKEHYESL